MHFRGLDPDLQVQNYFEPLGGLLVSFQTLMSNMKEREKSQESPRDYILDKPIYEADFLEVLGEFEKTVQSMEGNACLSSEEAPRLGDADLELPKAKRRRAEVAL